MTVCFPSAVVASVTEYCPRCAGGVSQTGFYVQRGVRGSVRRKCVMAEEFYRPS